MSDTATLVQLTGGTPGTPSGGVMSVQGADGMTPVLTGGKYNATAPTYSDGDATEAQADRNGNTQVSVAAMPPSASISNALSRAKITSANDVTSGSGLLNIFTGAGNLYERDIVNNSAAIVYAHFYDSAAASVPSMGSNADTNAISTLAMPANGGTLPPRNWPVAFTSGCWITFTTAYNNVTAPAAGAVTGTLGYKN